MAVSSLVAAAVVFLLLSSVAYAAATKPSNARVRGVVLFLGDSNLLFGSGQVVTAMTYNAHFDNGYVSVLAPRSGAGLRTADCPGNPFAPCATTNYWSTRIPQILARTKPSAIVVNLGVNDAVEAGTASTRGYTKYAAKIDAFMRLLPKAVPVLWTTTPCLIEPPLIRPGCAITNAALIGARARWPRLTLVPWAAVANPHPEWIVDFGKPGLSAVHYTPDGHTAWANTVVAALDTKLKAP